MLCTPPRSVHEPTSHLSVLCPIREEWYSGCHMMPPLTSSLAPAPPALQGEPPMGEKSKWPGLSYWGHCSSFLLESWIGTGAMCVSSAPPSHAARCPKCWPKLDMQIIKPTTAVTRAVYKKILFSIWQVTGVLPPFQIKRILKIEIE